MTKETLFRSDDIGVRFRLDARYEQSQPLPDPPGIHVASAHFTLSARGEWLASFHVVEAESRLPVVAPADLQREIDAFAALQREWDAEKVDIREPCHGAELAGLPAWHTAFVMLPFPGKGDDEGLEAPVLTHKYAVYEGRRRIHFDLTVLPPERYELERDALDLPFRTLEVERRG